MLRQRDHIAVRFSRHFFTVMITVISTPITIAFILNILMYSFRGASDSNWTCFALRRFITCATPTSLVIILTTSFNKVSSNPIFSGIIFFLTAYKTAIRVLHKKVCPKNVRKRAQVICIIHFDFWVLVVEIMGKC